MLKRDMQFSANLKGRNTNQLNIKMKKINIIVDEAIPLIHLLNSQEFEVIATSKEDVFAMTRKIQEENKDETYEHGNDPEHENCLECNAVKSNL